MKEDWAIAVRRSDGRWQQVAAAVNCPTAEQARKVALHLANKWKLTPLDLAVMKQSEWNTGKRPEPITLGWGS